MQQCKVIEIMKKDICFFYFLYLSKGSIKVGKVYCNLFSLDIRTIKEKGKH